MSATLHLPAESVSKSIQYRRDAEAEVGTLVKEHSYTTLLNEYNALIIGSYQPNFKAGMRLDSAVLDPLDGALGRLTIVCSKQTLGTGSGGSDGNSVELEWTQISKDIRQWAKTASTDPIVLPGLGLTNDELRTIDKALEGDTAAQAIVDADADMLKLYTKLLSGENGYLVPAPVLRMSTSAQANKAPNVNNGGMLLTWTEAQIIAAGFPAILIPQAGTTAAQQPFKWLKTTDRVIRQNNQWTRVQEWTGADVWDTDVYTAYSP